MPSFRIVIFSAVPPHRLRHFLWRLALDRPEVTVAGVLYETERPPLPRKERIARTRKFLRDPDFHKYALSKLTDALRARREERLHRWLTAAHAAPEAPNGPALTLEQLARDCEAQGIRFLVTKDFHAKASQEFVRSLDADLGVIYGTRILKPKLFEIPARGSINIHKHKVPEYRGGGAPGLWEMRDGRTEQGITVHRVLKEVDAGAVLGTRTFPIEPYDTLTSVGLKADLLSIDCLLEVIGHEADGTGTETPQTSEGTVYKGFQPHQVWTIERQIARSRAGFRPRNGRPLVKLLARLPKYRTLRQQNRARAEARNFPVVILFHHLISDRPKYMGLPTHEFHRQIRYLKRHYRIASLPEALAMLEKGNVPSPTVVLTFDDGYADNFLGLRAVAEAENIPVTLFICTEHVRSGRPFQHDVDRGEMDFPPLDWDQVRYLDRHGVTIAAHTRNHWDCGQGDEATLRHEIEGSLEDLRAELGHDVPWFSFPKGFPKNMPDAAQAIAHTAFPYVFSACGGDNRPPFIPGRMLNRRPHPESLLEVELALQGILEFDTEE